MNKKDEVIHCRSRKYKYNRRSTLVQVPGMRSRGCFALLSSISVSGALDPRRSVGCFVTNRRVQARDGTFRFVTDDQDKEHTSLDELSRNDDITSTSGSKEATEKPMSRLAMAAADWMEEEEDELTMYWERFDAAKSDKDRKLETQSQAPLSSDKGDDNSTSLSTEELLDRYYEGRKIDKKTEQKHSNEIEEAIVFASVSASSAMEAIQKLETVRSYLQVGSKLGGTGLLELAQAYQANGDESEASEIFHLLVQYNPQRDIRFRAKQLIENPSTNKKEYGRKGFWATFDDFWT